MESNQAFSRTANLNIEDEVKAPIRIQDRLSYHVPGNLFQKLQARPQASTYWSYEWYQNEVGKKVTVSYASTREASEELAKRFLKEKVLGFDMEWKADFSKKGNRNSKRKSSRTLKDEISLIQVASAHEIGLFHIALHKGTRPVELIARSLREIIESSSIIKTGVGIYSADASRLRRFMHLKPRGILDLNHLHRVVNISSGKKMISLSEHARIYLGFPLFKGKVRTSDWTKSLTIAQQNYAASDAYVGLVLYHVLDVTRLNMDPIPPHPELDNNPNPYNAAGNPTPKTVQLAQTIPQPIARQPDALEHVPKLRPGGGVNVIRYQDTTLFPPLSPSLVPSPPLITAKTARFTTDLPTPAPTITQLSPTKTVERRLLANLYSLRYRLQKTTGIPLEGMAGNETLINIAKQQPATVPALCRIPGAIKFYQTCKAHKINLLDFIVTPPTSISFDSSLSCTDVKSVETSHRQLPAGFPCPGDDQNGSPSRGKQSISKSRKRSCSSALDTEFMAKSPLRILVNSADQCGSAQKPILIPSSPIFFETMEPVIKSSSDLARRRDALAEIFSDSNIPKKPSRQRV